MLGFLPTRAYRPGTPGATTFLSPLSGTFNYGWDSFLFTPFHTTKSTGLGMGLAISRSIIEEHRGEIWAERNPDRGVSFHFTLPGAG